MNSYEAVFILSAALDADAAEKTVEDIKSVITKNKGEVADVQNWGKKRFSFLIKKQVEGYYYLANFQIDPLMIKKLESTYRLNDSILRVLIVRKDA